MKGLSISPVTRDTLKEVAGLARQLWPDYHEKELLDLFEVSSTGREKEILAAAVEGKLIGFAQIGLRRDYVEGTQSSPVGYIEGIFVVPEFRKMGVARQLLMAAERWSLSQGCTEMGSDTELSNELSQRFHKSCGFEEAGVVVHFTKRIQP